MSPPPTRSRSQVDVTRYALEVRHSTRPLLKHLGAIHWSVATIELEGTIRRIGGVEQGDRNYTGINVTPDGYIREINDPDA